MENSFIATNVLPTEVLNDLVDGLEKEIQPQLTALENIKNELIVRNAIPTATTLPVTYITNRKAPAIIKGLRIEAGMTQSALSKKAGYSNGVVYRVEKGLDKVIKNNGEFSPAFTRLLKALNVPEGVFVAK